MNAEDRLRKAIAARTNRIEPAPDGLDRIEEALMQPTEINARSRWVIGGSAAAAIVIVALVALWFGGDDDNPEGVATQPGVTTTAPEPESTEPSPDTTADPPSPTTEAPPATPTTDPESVATTVPSPTTPPDSPVSPETVVWPRPGHDVRFDDPVAVASSFARFYAGFTDPLVGSFAEGDSRSGEVEIRPSGRSDGPVTTVLVRRMADDHWWVIAASSADITIDQVAQGTIDCSGTVRITGTVLAFEGHVDVRIDGFRVDGSREPLGDGYGTGSGSPPAAPFEADVRCDAGADSRSDTGGVVMAWTDGGESSERWQVTAMPVALRP